MSNIESLDGTRTGIRFAGLTLRRDSAIQWGLFLFSLVIVVGPLIPLFYQSFIATPIYDGAAPLTLGNYAALGASGDFQTALFNSLIFALGASVVAAILGGALAILIGRTNLPGRRLFGMVALWPMFISPVVMAIGWFQLYGPAGYFTGLWQQAAGGAPWSLYTMAGMIFVAGVTQAPVVYLYCLASSALADASMEDAARICGAGPWTIMRRVTVPLLLPALLASGFLNLTNCLEMLSIPLILGEPAGIRLLTPFLFSQAFAGFRADYGIIAAAAVVLLVIVMVLVFAQSFMLRDAQRFKSVGGKASHARAFALGRLRWPLFALALAYCGLFIVGPVAVLLLRSVVSFLNPLVPFWSVLTLSNYTGMFSSELFQRSMINTAILAVVGGAAVSTYAALVSLVVYRSNFRFRHLLEYVAMFPRAIPGMIAGIAFLYSLLVLPGSGVVRNTIWIFVIVFMSRLLPTAIGAFSPALIQIGPELDRSARVMGSDWWTTCTSLLLKLTRPALFSAFVIVCVQIVREYSTALFLVAPGSEIIGVTLLQAWAQGDVGRVAALSTVQILMIAVLVIGARKLLGVKLYR